MQTLAVLVFEVVTPMGEDLIDRKKLDDLSLGKIGRLIENESSFADLGSERFHDPSVAGLLLVGHYEVRRAIFR